MQRGRFQAHSQKKPVAKPHGIADATSVIPMITPTCRERLTAADFDFIIRTLAGSGQRRSASLAELLTDSETRDSILDSEPLFQAVLEAGANLQISPQCYFYVLLRTS